MLKGYFLGTIVERCFQHVNVFNDPILCYPSLVNRYSCKSGRMAHLLRRETIVVSGLRAVTLYLGFILAQGKIMNVPYLLHGTLGIS